MEIPVELFVYGSLMRGLKHHDQMKGAQFLRRARLCGYQLVLYQEGYPALVVRTAPSTAKSSASAVEGELFAVGPEQLVRLDLFEECPDLYQRGSVVLADGSSAQAYLIGPELARSCTEIPGDYRSYLKTTGLRRLPV
jgi:gamma-glutamylcyclotransferase (GGCT)/AIG2-like uncharacterized protein YtfP